jgi:hypothetical protein
MGESTVKTLTLSLFLRWIDTDGDHSIWGVYRTPSQCIGRLLWSDLLGQYLFNPTNHCCVSLQELTEIVLWARKLVEVPPQTSEGETK